MSAYYIGKMANIKAEGSEPESSRHREWPVRRGLGGADTAATAQAAGGGNRRERESCRGPCVKGLSSGGPAAAWQPPDRLYKVIGALHLRNLMT